LKMLAMLLTEFNLAKAFNPSGLRPMVCDRLPQTRRRSDLMQTRSEIQRFIMTVAPAKKPVRARPTAKAKKPRKPVKVETPVTPARETPVTPARESPLTPVRPSLSKDMLSKVQSELYRATNTPAADLIVEQRKVIVSLLSAIEEELPQEEPDPKKEEFGKQTAALTKALDRVLAPHLPVLLARSFPMAAREVLGNIETEGQRAALLALAEYITGVHTEITDKLEENQELQHQKILALCAAAQEGGDDALIQRAQIMKDKLDNDFINYLNYAIHQEKLKLKAKGIKPHQPVPGIYGVLGLDDEQKEAIEDEQKRSRRLLKKNGLKHDVVEKGDTAHLEDDYDPAAAFGILPGTGGNEWEQIVGGTKVLDAPKEQELAQQAEAHAALKASQQEEEEEEDEVIDVNKQYVPKVPKKVEAQQGLLILQLVKQGVYELLATGVRDDVAHIRYIIGMDTPEARQELTRTTLLKMPAEEQEHFQETLKRITENLAFPRNDRDRELHEKVRELGDYVRQYHEDFGKPGGSSRQGMGMMSGVY